MNSKALKKLTDKWYAKLAKSGFKDIEETKYKYPGLKEWATSIQFQYSPQTYVERERFYQLATQLLHEDVWLTRKDKKMWGLYCGGMSFINMACECDVNIRTVFRKIKYYSAYIKS